MWIASPSSSDFEGRRISFSDTLRLWARSCQIAIAINQVFPQWRRGRSLAQWPPANCKCNTESRCGLHPCATSLAAGALAAVLAVHVEPRPLISGVDVTVRIGKCQAPGPRTQAGLAAKTLALQLSRSKRRRTSCRRRYSCLSGSRFFRSSPKDMKRKIAGHRLR